MSACGVELVNSGYDDQKLTWPKGDYRD